MANVLDTAEFRSPRRSPRSGHKAAVSGKEDTADNSAVNTVLAFQHPSGGFGGGPANSHLPHLLPNWASVCSLAQTGSAAPGGGWDSLAKGRQGMYDFFMRCKQPNGGFVVCDGGEIDVR